MMILYETKILIFFFKWTVFLTLNSSSLLHPLANVWWLWLWSQGWLTVDGFHQFLLGPENDMFVIDHSEVYQDMKQPFPHYYLASSHNTYLMEDQLVGPSSIEAYVNSLRKGCRCVECKWVWFVKWYVWIVALLEVFRLERVFFGFSLRICHSFFVFVSVEMV